jgi:hypothetical protein
MADTINNHKHRDPIKHELENASFDRTAAPSHPRPLQPINEINPKSIPQFFLDTILEVIAKTIEKVLAEILARSVAEGIEGRLRPLTNEINLLRIAIEHDWDSANRRKQGNSTKVADDAKE